METRTVTIVDPEFDETQAYRDLVKASTQHIPPGAFTRKQFRQDTGMADTSSWKRLNELVQAGMLDTKFVSLDGCQVRVYWFKEQDGASQS